ncbi:MAG: UDP-N-acetylmuramoylalanine--D-glutamate ligase [Candidatus Lloydbacteria bacterium RIFCSPHIGHO2_01_FULL_49_22]|uniref:UDP-N-acetylmuramoylalanine--D-glutamate ligase n=1 Tax=Candidatus Lloydbacteria bacterium RIFCSPHIGHO2_01_FULL_49_22 TaxID=1798658 RepID=A0A1G2CYE0_9BACT|nr:MAG: UDP-N-acetylmuramoylalanine--D-glutamate ligase [Candidatus Lloydbacteria bacterium RIFCSPHIGHO2_01_FULL_49_22]OGZ10145.1 MAG: UDP-N-acetylmuramoylalanine--D-glutamate ligase [Candidatus Lloydbacteria bacterium RIFCSPHIGHO2_02_FULL_50_18]
MSKTVRRKIGKEHIFTGIRALVMGLGLHGGGVATAKWLARHGAKVTATDKRTKEILVDSIRALQGVPVKYVLGGHRHQDFRTNDLIVVNPGVPRESEYLETAIRAGKRIENDASLFFRYSTNPVIAITGTRGKTTVTLWVATLLQKKYHDVLPSGNTPDNAFLKEFERLSACDARAEVHGDIPVVAEMSSWQLERLSSGGRAPHVAVVTNLYPDHLNRYNGIRDYANAKVNIFLFQQSDDFLILNHENAWTPYFLKKKPKALLFFISKKALPKNAHGLFVRSGMLIFRFDGMEQKLFSIKRFTELYGVHNLENLMNAVLAVKLFDPTIAVSLRDVLHLPTPKMRQEIVAKKGRLTIVNDSCATSPDGTIAAIERFRKMGNIVLVTGGTDKNLEFGALAMMIKKFILAQNLILLEGSATKKLIAAFPGSELSRLNLDKKVLKNLDSCVAEAFRAAKKLTGKTTILFSPGAASFEKFLHEFDRGEQFNILVKKYKK